jgi:hypothetical protein
LDEVGEPVKASLLGQATPWLELATPEQPLLIGELLEEAYKDVEYNGNEDRTG